VNKHRSGGIGGGGSGGDAWVSNSLDVVKTMSL